MSYRNKPKTIPRIGDRCDVVGHLYDSEEYFTIGDKVNVIGLDFNEGASWDIKTPIARIKSGCLNLVRRGPKFKGRVVRD